VLFISNGGSSNVAPFNKTGNEYVNNTVINKSVMKLMTNYKSIVNHLNFRYIGELNPATNLVTSTGLSPLTITEKQTINSIFDNNCFINVNEKTAPQVLNRVFECLYEKGAAITNSTNIFITNENQLAENLSKIIPINTPTATPSVTPSPSRTPSTTPSITPTSSIAVTPTTSVTPSPTPTPSVTQTPPTYYSLTINLISDQGGGIRGGYVVGGDGTLWTNLSGDSYNFAAGSSISLTSIPDGGFIIPDPNGSSVAWVVVSGTALDFGQNGQAFGDYNTNSITSLSANTELIAYYDTQPY
jgi:hypothetical protein